ncbi:MAG TPA: 1-acyl-sn-glycerol-3-phosphate acyltransferase [bacterium]|nr:1-acyl-sn-glycerol-3-phosphate acyltransferase [bacterium]
MAWMSLTVVQRIGGAKIAPLPQVSGGPGVLILMNHQSLLDIPLIVRCLNSGYPKIVTRRRYRKGIPLVSHMLRLYEYPIVDSQSPPRRQIVDLRRAALHATQPMVIFPEGTRSKDGEIGPFMKAGLSGILAVRPWLVYLAVADGFWRCGRIQEFGKNLSAVRGAVETMGPFEFRKERDDPALFMDAMRERMCLKLREMRDGQRLPNEPPN